MMMSHRLTTRLNSIAAILFLISIAVLLHGFSLRASGQVNNREVAVTFDDLPAMGADYAAMNALTENLLARLKAETIPAIGFVNEYRLADGTEKQRRIALLKRWLDDGHGLGNHSFSHVAIDRVPFEKYAADVIKGETVTRQLLRAKGKELRYYRHTQLRTGPTEQYKKQLAEFLATRGYTAAPVTIDNNDYIYTNAYSQAKSRGDAPLQKRIVEDYVRYLESIFEHFEKLSREFLGYEVKQTLLLHANEINADHFDKLAAMLRRRGYTFISLDAALKDPAYKLPEAQSKRGLSWLHRWMLAKGLAMKEEPLQPDWITKLAQQGTR